MCLSSEFLNWLFPISLVLTSVLTVEAISKNIRVRKSYSSHLVWGLLVLSLYFVYISYTGISTINADGTPNQSSLDMLGLGLGLIGLVITALTGMALATAWRAKDHAQTALEKLDKEYSQIKIKLSRSIAYADLLNLSMKKLNRVEKSTLVNMLKAVSEEDQNQSHVFLKSISDTPRRLEQFRSFGPSTVSFVKLLEEILASQETSREYKSTVRKLLI